jgi:hypothetical protein
MFKSILMVGCILVAAIALQPPAARAQTASYSPLAFVYVGALFVNGGAALANGLALTMDRPDRRNGEFGLVLGATSMILAGALYAVDHESQYSEEAALMLGGAGLVAAVTGGWAIRASRKKEAVLEIIPSIVPRTRSVSVGLMMQF